MDWPKEIGVAFLVRQHLRELDTECLWPYHLPEVAAAEEEIVTLETKVGERLDEQHREFLKYANGWKGFYHDVDLFGTTQLMGSPEMERAKGILLGHEDMKSLCGFTRDELLPVAVSRSDIDVFAIARRQSPCPGRVIWLAGGVIDQFPGFDEFFLSMVDYNRRNIDRLKKLVR